MDSLSFLYYKIYKGRSYYNKWTVSNSESWVILEKVALSVEFYLVECDESNNV